MIWHNFFWLVMMALLANIAGVIMTDIPWLGIIVDLALAGVFALIVTRQR